MEPRICKGCGHLFLSSGEDRCGKCAPKRQPFPPKPIDLWEQWS